MAHRDPTNTDNLQRLDQYELDEFERGTLAVMRQFLASHAQPDTQAWHHAFLIATERWGEPIGLAVAHALSKYVNAVMRFRGETFAFHQPLDLNLRAFITDDEAILLAVLHYMRRDETGPARDAIAALTLGQMDPDIIRTGLSFAHRFSAGATAKPARDAAPMLSVVG